jgi:hypothetical protein
MVVVLSVATGFAMLPIFSKEKNTELESPKKGH